MRNLFLSIAAAIVTLVLAILAIYTTTITTKLHLPIPPLLHALALVLPLLNITALTFSFRNQKSTSLLSLHPTILPILFFLDAVLLTLSTNYIEPQTLQCALEQRWGQLFQHKNERAIRGIQDAFDCCGFNTVQHQAWPFPGQGRGATACVEMYGRTRACEGPWIAKSRMVLGVAVAIAVVTVMGKVIVYVLVKRRPAWFQQQGGRSGYVEQGRIAADDEEGHSEAGRLYLDQPVEDRGSQGGERREERVLENGFESTGRD